MTVSCGACSKDLRRTDKIILCSGSCERVFHAHCLLLDEKEIKVLSGNSRLGWFCSVCMEKKGARMEGLVEKILEKVLQQEETLKKICEMMHTTESKIDDSLEKMAPMSYADKLKKKEPETVVVIKPKNLQNSVVTKSELKQKFNPAELEITGLKNISKGGVAVGCKPESLQKLKKQAEEKLGVNYNIMIPKLRAPKVRIYGFSEKYDKEELIDSLQAQNDFLGTDSTYMEVLYISVKPNNAGRYCAIVETDGASYNELLLRGVVNIGWDRCRVFDAVDIRRCYKCLGFMHKANECKNEKACSKCGANHDASKCTSDELKCINCVKAVEKFKVKLDVHHDAWSTECPVFKRKLELERSRTDFCSTECSVFKRRLELDGSRTDFLERNNQRTVP